MGSNGGTSDAREETFMKRLGSIAIAVVMGAIVSGLGSGSAIAIPSICDGIAGNLVANCGFETGTFSSWTQSGNTDFTGTNGNVHSGNFGAEFGPQLTLGFITQNLSTTVGGTYDLAFWLQNDSGTPVNHFEAAWNGVIIFALDDSPAFSYTLFTFPVTATSASTPLQFGFRHDPAFWDFDDVSVVAAAAAAVPGPSSLLLIGSGLAGFAIWWRRRS